MQISIFPQKNDTSDTVFVWLHQILDGTRNWKTLNTYQLSLLFFLFPTSFSLESCKMKLQMLVKKTVVMDLRSKETRRKEKGRGRRTLGREEEITGHLLSGNRKKCKIRDDPI